MKYTEPPFEPKTWKPSDIYQEKPHIPSDYNVIDFRPVKTTDEWYLGPVTRQVRAVVGTTTEPRLILQKVKVIFDWWE